MKKLELTLRVNTDLKGWGGGAKTRFTSHDGEGGISNHNGHCCQISLGQKHGLFFFMTPVAGRLRGEKHAGRKKAKRKSRTVLVGANLFVNHLYIFCCVQREAWRIAAKACAVRLSGICRNSA